MKSDIQIASEAKIEPIGVISDSLGIDNEFLEPYTRYTSKINLNFCDRIKNNQKGKLILVSAITPTPAGEGKTTMSIGLSMGLNKIGHKSIVTLREPSLGPLFGIKGGATGGGFSQVLPMENINMHFTGDLHAVTAAHNLIAAVLDNHIYRRKLPLFDPRRLIWDRVLDMNDRSLRDAVIGLGGRFSGVPRETAFNITASSEIMAILCLAESYEDLKTRLGKILLGFTYEGAPVYLDDLKITGAVAAVLRDALKPNIVQTIEGTPAFVHGGPFANIAQGTCSVISMKTALRLSDYVVTEAGFGFDLGAEKFFDIVSRSSELDPRAVVLVATVRALKMHGGVNKKELNNEDPGAVEKGIENLEKHLENIAKFNLPAIVAINEFHLDTECEIKIITDYLEKRNIPYSIVKSHAEGGVGAMDLAEQVVQASEHNRHFNPLYSLKDSIKDKIFTIASEIYGSSAVDYTKEAEKDIKTIKRLNLEKLPVCIAKTQKSLSDNPDLLGRPYNFLVTVRNIKISSGAGFLVPITGDIMLMPGLPKTPAAESIDLDNNGNITGLF